jgi:hypothetical protein
MIEMFLLISLLVLSLLNLLFLFFIGAYLVRLRDQIVIIVEGLSNQNVKSKQVTSAWETKYEAELDAIKKRLQADSGLVDLSLPKVRPVE